MFLRIAEEVAAALAADQGVVALESTLLAHGLPTRRALASERSDALEWADSRPRTRIVDLYQ